MSAKRLVLRSEHLTELTATELAAVVGAMSVERPPTVQLNLCTLAC